MSRPGRAVKPTPSRITAALDIRGLYGPEVDEACGVQEPAVDQWEAGELVPTRAQVARLALLTGFPVEYFYRPPVPDAPAIFLCRRGRQPRRTAEPPKPAANPSGWADQVRSQIGERS